MLAPVRLNSPGPANPTAMVDFNQAKQFLDQHDEQVDQALDKGGDAAKSRFAGHDQQIDGAVDKAQEATGQGDTTEQPPPPPA
jgi:antitoxin protein of toxin-antitoxin system